MSVADTLISIPSLVLFANKYNNFQAVRKFLRAKLYFSLRLTSPVIYVTKWMKETLINSCCFVIIILMFLILKMI